MIKEILEKMKLDRNGEPVLSHNKILPTEVHNDDDDIEYIHEEEMNQIVAPLLDGVQRMRTEYIPKKIVYYPSHLRDGNKFDARNTLQVIMEDGSTIQIRYEYKFGRRIVKMKTTIAWFTNRLSLVAETHDKMANVKLDSGMMDWKVFNTPLVLLSKDFFDKLKEKL